MVHRDDDSEGSGGTRWYLDVLEALREKPPADVARELPGLVDYVAGEADGDEFLRNGAGTGEEGSGAKPVDEPEVSHYLVGVSFSTNHTCLDYAVDRVYVADDGEPLVEPAKAPASASHRYVHFTHPPDPHFDASALRARLLAAVDEERRELTSVETPTSRFADVWEQL